MAIENNMVVSLEYELRDKATSDIIDSNVGESPLEFITGRNHIIPGLESEILNMSERNARRIVSALIKDGLLQSQSHRAPLTIGLPIDVLPYYFPDLYEPSVIGEEYII